MTLASVIRDREITLNYVADVESFEPSGKFRYMHVAVRFAAVLPILLLIFFRRNLYQTDDKVLDAGLHQIPLQSQIQCNDFNHVTFRDIAVVPLPLAGSPRFLFSQRM